MKSVTVKNLYFYGFGPACRGTEGVGAGSREQGAEVRGQRSEVRDQRSEVGGRRSEVGGGKENVRKMGANGRQASKRN